MKLHLQNSKVAYIYVRFLQVVSWCKICCKNVQSKQNFGIWMYFEIKLSVWELQGIYVVVLEIRNRWKIFFSVSYLHVIYKAWKKMQLMRRIYNSLKYAFLEFTTPYCNRSKLRLTKIQSNLLWTILPWKR